MSNLSQYSWAVLNRKEKQDRRKYYLNKWKPIAMKTLIGSAIRNKTDRKWALLKAADAIQSTKKQAINKAHRAMGKILGIARRNTKRKYRRQQDWLNEMTQYNYKPIRQPFLSNIGNINARRRRYGKPEYDSD